MIGTLRSSGAVVYKRLLRFHLAKTIFSLMIISRIDATTGDGPVREIEISSVE
jgi:hypothetical protein